jgi:hypothetical protein
MAKHRDSGEQASHDMTAAALLNFTTKAGLNQQMRPAIGEENYAALDAAARQHERRQRRQ